MFPTATANGAVAQPTVPGMPAYEVGGIFGPDNRDFGGGWSPAGNLNTNTAVGAPSFMDKVLGYRDGQGNAFQGWGGLAIGGAQALGGLYLGMKQYNLAKDSLAFQKDAFAKNFETQKNLTNAQLEDRQRARVASNAGAYQSVGDYMNKNGVK
jgi:hypothetical protein